MKIPMDMLIPSPFLGNYYCLMEQYGMAFVVISKCGVTHLKNIAVYARSGYYPQTPDDAHSLIGYDERNGYLCRIEKMRELEERTKLLKFAVWRDPVERLVSTYKFFCLERENRFYFRYLALYEDNSFDRFMEFVRFELGKSNPLYQDEHIRKQSDFYQPKDVDWVVPIHKLNRFLVEHGVHLKEEKANETHVSFKLTNEDYISEIKEMYEADYDILLNCPHIY